MEKFKQIPGVVRVQAANADIGVARAAYFPAFNLSGSIGFESTKIKNLLKHPSLAWSVGPSRYQIASVQLIKALVVAGKIV